MCTKEWRCNMSSQDHIRQKLGLSASVTETVLETTPNPYVLKDKNGVYVYVNRAFAKFLGKEKKDILGKTDYHLFPAEEAKKYQIGDKAVMSGGQQQKEEWQVLGDTGLVWLQVIKTPVLDKESKVTGVLCSVSNIARLKGALEKVRLLSGMLSICTSCKKIRDDKGYWNQIETYIRDNSEAEFSHGICPDCAKQLYPDLVNKDGKVT